jgi:hemerythrin superfamily protein
MVRAMAEQMTRTITQVLLEQHELIRDLFDQVGMSSGEQRAEVFDCLRATLAVHETAEEELVHPAVRRMGADAAAAVQVRLDEEGAAKRMLSTLERMGVDGDGFDDLFADFQASVLEHAEAEEDEVFPFLDQGLDDDEQRRMADTFEVLEQMAPSHPHPHGPESALGNLVVGPFVAMVDKVRDAIKR